MVNKSKTYLLPLLNEYVPIENLHLLINTYIYFNKETPKNTIGLLYGIDDSAEFFMMVSNYEANDLLIDYTMLDKEILFLFSFPDDFLSDYEHFSNGSYSLMSDQAKTIIIQFTNYIYQYQPIVTELVDILYKRDARKKKLELELNISLTDKDELSSKINPSDETYKLQIL